MNQYSCCVFLLILVKCTVHLFSYKLFFISIKFVIQTPLRQATVLHNRFTTTVYWLRSLLTQFIGYCGKISQSSGRPKKILFFFFLKCLLITKQFQHFQPDTSLKVYLE